MKRKIFAANWKLYKNPQETKKFFTEFLIPGTDSELYFFPPALCVEQALICTQGTRVQIGLQNISEYLEGAFTGENSAQTAKTMGCSAILVGHSERRTMFLETNEQIHKKVITAIVLNLKVMLCIGETLQERESGKTEVVLQQQLEIALKGVADCSDLMIAYEPVWAIGTGKTATPKLANDTHQFIFSWLQSKGWEKTPILYGGSVKPENSQELMNQEFISGFLVGGASLNPESFARICQSL